MAKNKNKNKKPKGGLYGGDPGKAAANQSPDVYLESLFREAGLLTGSGSDFDTYISTVLIPQIIGDWNVSQTKNQKQSIIDYVKKTYGGAGYHGNKGKVFKPGDFGNEATPSTVGWGTALPTQPARPPNTSPPAGNQPTQPVTGIRAKPAGNSNIYTGAKPAGGGSGTTGGGGNPAHSGYNTWYANQNPMGYATAQAINAGHIAGNGNQQYQGYLQNTYLPGMQTQFSADQLGGGPKNFDAWMATQDPEKARRAYAHRGSGQRQPTGQPVGGRWSWWA